MLSISIDDVGADEAINQSAVELIERQIIRSVSLIVNYPEAERIGSYLRKSNARVGLHVNLTSGTPIARLDEVPSLVDSRGNFVKPMDFMLPSETFVAGIDRYINNHARKLDEREALLEVERQRRKFKRLLGRNPDFASFHHDIDRVSRVSDAVAVGIAPCRGRQARLNSSRLASYQCAFAQQNETLVEYKQRIYGLLRRLRRTSGDNLVVFHPSVNLPSETFTVYRTERIMEYRLLIDASECGILSQESVGAE